MTTSNVTIDEAGTEERPLLEIRDLAISFQTASGEFQAVKNAHLTIMPGETVAIVVSPVRGSRRRRSPPLASCRRTAGFPAGRSCSTARTSPTPRNGA
ncbi:ABC transporter protein [Arthrobacter sp. Hiyo1]|nr:ABC transporter protein [Arthrobacter sp. Hiyo1]